MLCQICQLKTAEIKISHIINDKRVEIQICSECADEKGVNNPLINLPQLFGNVVEQLLGDELFSKGSENSGAKCPGCGCLWEQFQENGLLGCDICYQFFEEDLKIVLRRIHGSNQHIGSRPKSCRYLVDESELANIRVDLKRAINSENFERAAELRDMLRDANRETDKKDAAILR